MATLLCGLDLRCGFKAFTDPYERRGQISLCMTCSGGSCFRENQEVVAMAAQVPDMINAAFVLEDIFAHRSSKKLSACR